MARPNQEAIDTFISVTGASEDVAVRKLQEHGGDLNAAVDAHFIEQDRTIGDEMMEMMDMSHQRLWEGAAAASSVFSSARGNSDPLFGGSLFDIMSEFWRRTPFGSFGMRNWNEPFVSHPRQVREIPIEVKDGNGSGNGNGNGNVPTIEDVTHASHAYAHEPEIHGTVTFAGEDDV